MISDLDILIQRFSVGSVSLGDIEVLVHFAKDLDLVVELGTNVGTTTILLSAVAKKVYTVDVFEKIDLIEDEGQRGTYAKSFGNNKHYYDFVRKKLRPFGIETYQGLSYKLAESFMPGTVDMIFIDADHSYEGVKKDYEAWFSRVKIGGYFAFHDCVNAFPVFRFKNDVLNNDKRIINVSVDLIIDSPSLTSTVVFKRVR